MSKAKELLIESKAADKAVTFGICAACDPRIDNDSRVRTVNIIKKIAGIVADQVKMPGGEAVKVVWTPLLIDGEKQADAVADQFKSEGVDAIICTPDTWAYPQKTMMSLMAHFPDDMPDQ